METRTKQKTALGGIFVVLLGAAGTVFVPDTSPKYTATVAYTQFDTKGVDRVPSLVLEDCESWVEQLVSNIEQDNGVVETSECIPEE